MPYSSSLGVGRQEIIDRDVIEGMHYKRATAEEIQQWEKDDKTLFVRSEADQLGGARTSGGFGGMGGIVGSANAGKSCVLTEEIIYLKNQYKVWRTLECTEYVYRYA